jgi:hypothetical protein
VWPPPVTAHPLVVMVWLPPVVKHLLAHPHYHRLHPLVLGKERDRWSGEGWGGPKRLLHRPLVGEARSSSGGAR